MQVILPLFCNTRNCKMVLQPRLKEHSCKTDFSCFGETTQRHTQTSKVTHIHTTFIIKIGYAGKIEHYCSKLFEIGQVSGLRSHHFIDIYAINIVHNIHATNHNHTQRHV